MCALLVWPLALHSQITSSARSARSIAGRLVFASDGRPAEGYRVEVKAFGGVPVQTVFTNWNGDFEFGALAPGVYTVVVEDSCCLPIQQTVDSSFSSPAFVQLELKRLLREDAGPAGATISVRELKIPSGARAAFQKGLDLLAKNPAGSLNHFKQAAAAYSSYYEAYYQMGLAQMKLGLDAEAEQNFLKAIELSQSRYVEPQLALAFLFCRRKEFDAAERLVLRAHERDARSWFGHYVLGWARINLNRLDEAEKSLQQSVARNPGHAQTHLLLGHIHLKQGRYAEVVADLDAYLAIEPAGTTTEKARQLREEIQRGLSKPAAESAPAEKQP